MKSVFKHFSKKAMSLVLVVCIVITTMLTTLTVFAAPPPYTVTYGAPAIPMVINTKVTLGDNLEFEFTKDTAAVLGSAVTVVDYDDTLVYDATARTFTAYVEGVFPITLSDGTNEREFYIVVAKTADGPFNLFEYNFANYTADIADDKFPFAATEWRKNSGSWKENVALTLTYDAGKSAVKLPNSQGSMLYLKNNGVVENFSDYTVNTTMQFTPHASDNWCAAGVAARMNLVDGAFVSGTTNVLALFSSTAGTNNLTFIRNGDYGWGNGSTDLTLTDAMYDYTYTFEGDVFTMSAAPEGQAQVQYIDGIGDITANHLGTNGHPLNAGVAGIYSESRDAFIKKFSVALNEVTADDLNAIGAVAVDPLYAVTIASPAIPMNSLTVLNTKDILVETADGFVFGDTLDFELKDNTSSISIDNDNDTISALKKGIYKVVAKSAGNEVATLYVVVKDAADTEFVLYSSDFTIGDAADFAGWSQHTKKDGSSAWVRNTALVNSFTTISNQGDGRFKYTGDTGSGLVISQDTASGMKWGSHGAAILENDIVSAFSDYTVDTKIFGRSGGNYNETGFGVFGRVGITAGSTLNSGCETKSIIYNVINNSKCKTNKFSISNAGAVSLAENANYTLQSASPTTMKYTFAGDTLTVNIGTGSAVVREDMSTNKGAVGVYAGIYEGGYFAVIKSFKITLNNTATDMPKATALDLYQITGETPAIPMDLLSVVDMSKTLVEIEGEPYFGDTVTYSCTDDAIVIDNAEHTISARGTGVFPIKAAVDENETILYAVVKLPSETEFVLYSTDFTIGDNADFAGWSQHTKVDDSSAWVRNTALVNSFTTISNQGDGRFKYTGDTANGLVISQDTASGMKWGSHGAAVLENDIVSAFSDYTVDSKIFGRSGSNYNETGFGVFGRVGITAGSTLNSGCETKSIIYNVINNSKCKTNKFSISNAGAVSLAENANYTLQSASPTTMKYVFASDKLTVNIGTGADVVCEDINTNKGAVGVYAGLYEGGYFAVIKSFKVTLNAGTQHAPYKSSNPDVEAAKDGEILYIGLNKAKALDGFYVQLGNIYYKASEVQWAAAADSVDWAGAFSATATELKGTKAGLYKATVTHATAGTATVYINTHDNSAIPDDGYVDNGNYKFSVNSSGELNKYEKIYAELDWSEKVVFPSEVDGKAATVVGTNLFNSGHHADYCTTIKSAYFSNGIKKIGDSSFNGAVNLVKVYFPDTLEIIDNYAMMGLQADTVVIPDSVTSIGVNAFHNTTNMTTLTIGKGLKKFPESFTTWDNEIGSKKNKVTGLTLPYNIEEVADKSLRAFGSLNEIWVLNRDVDLTNSGLDVAISTRNTMALTIYGAEYASDGVSPSPVKVYAEAHPDEFIFVSHEAAIKEIEKAAKEELEKQEEEFDKLANKENPNAVYKVTYWDNSTSYSLTAFTPDTNPENGGKYTLPAIATAYQLSSSSSNPDKTTGVTVENAKVVEIGPNILKNHPNASNVYNLVIPSGYKIVGDSAFIGLTKLRYLTLGDTVTDIKNWAFSGATDLRKLDIPDSLINIGKSSFANATSLEEINIDLDNSVLASIGETAFTNAKVKQVKLPVTTSQIGKQAFAGSKLQEVWIYNKEAVIGEEAFPAGCKIYCVAGSTAEQYAKDNGYTYDNTLPDILEQKLTTPDPNPQFKIGYSNGTYSIIGYEGQGGLVKIPSVLDYTNPEDNSVTKNAPITEIGSNAFKNSGSKGKVFAVEIPEGITVIGDSAFNGCVNLQRVKLPDSLVRIESWAFSYGGFKDPIVLGVECSEIKSYAFANANALESITIYNKNAVIGDNAFPETLLIRGIKGSTAQAYAEKHGNPFEEVQPLPEVTIDSIPDNGNYQFTTSGAGSIDGYKRKDDTKDYSQKITFPTTIGGQKVDTIASNLFKSKPYTTTIQAVIIPEGIKTIGDSAFVGASRLKFIQLPASIEVINDWAFLGTNIKGDIVLGEKIKKIGNGAFSNLKNLDSVTIHNPTAVIHPSAFSGCKEGFTLRGLDNSTAYEYYIKNKKNGVQWESIGVYDKPEDPTDDPTENPTPNDSPNGDDLPTQQNKDDNDTQASTEVGLFGLSKDVTLLLVLALAGMIFLLLVGAVVIILIAISGDDDDDDFDDDDDLDDDDFDDDDFDDDFDDDDFDEEFGDEE